MISDEEMERPTADGVLKNPYFWDNEQILDFLMLVKNEGKPKNFMILQKFREKAQVEVLAGTSWKEFKPLNKNDSEIALDILNGNKEFEELDENSIFDLVKFITIVVRYYLEYCFITILKPIFIDNGKVTDSN